jgi:hypothetical protein
MRSYRYEGPPFTEPRSHPWVGAAGHPEAHYYDLTATPALIRSSLEDFLPWSRHAAIERFFCLLEWLNQPDSLFESNDCAFTGPEPNENRELPATFECQGRVMLLFRALELNQSDNIASLESNLQRRLERLDPSFDGGAIGTTTLPVRYRALPAGDQEGYQLMISFWAWGDSERECLLSLERVMRSLSAALHDVSRGAARALRRQD